MTNLQSSAGWPQDFCGEVRLFPLPDLVLFPNVVQPLHIFEPRYCKMLTSALESDRLLAMALLMEGWENEFLDRPSIASTVCVGKIISQTSTDDGRHNILLAGIKRARIVKELDSPTPYRVAKVDVLEDYYPEDAEQHRTEITEKLQSLFSSFVPEGLAAQASFKELVGKQLPLGILTDTITFALNVPLAVKQQLLAENNVDVRCRLLIRCLEQKLMASDDSSCGLPADDFPPPFSEN